MTIQELKNLIRNIPDDYTILIEYDGEWEDTWTTIPADYLEIHNQNKTVVICDIEY